MFNEFLNEFLHVVLIVITPIIATCLCKALSSVFVTLKTWTKAEKYKKYIDMAEQDLYKAVKTTTETFVKQLKQTERFDQKAMDEAFNKSKQSFLSIINDETFEVLREIKGDVDEWIRVSIEDYVEIQKSLLCSTLNSERK